MALVEKRYDLLPPSYRCQWQNEASGSSFVRLAYNTTPDVKPKQGIGELEDQFKAAGIPKCHPEQHFAGLPDRKTLTHRSSIDSCGIVPSDKTSYAFTPQPISRSALVELSDDCPSLDSVHGDSSDGTVNGDTIVAPQASTTACTASQRSIPRRGLSIFDSILKVLSTDPLFAEAVISKIRCLPPDKRKVLIDDDATDNTECTDGSSSQSSKSSEPPFKKHRPNNSSNKHRGGKRPAGDDAPGDDGDVGDGRRDGDKGKPQSSEKSDKGKRRWICPFDLAYPDMWRNDGFNFCSPGNMTERYQWRSHLEIRHSEKAKAKDKRADENARFYMNDHTLSRVQAIYNDYDRRPHSERDEYATRLFIAVWDVLFPNDELANFQKPLSAFHPEGPETQNLAQYLLDKADILVNIMFEAKADEALRTGAADYLPSAPETKAILSASMAVILHNSPAATGATHWLAHAPDDAVRTAGRDYVAHAARRAATTPSEERVEEGAETETHGPFAQPTTEPETPPLVPQVPIMSVPIYPSGTHFQAVPFPNHVQNGPQMLHLTLPPGVSIMYEPAGPGMGFRMHPGTYDPTPSPRAPAVSPQHVNRHNTTQNRGQGVPPQEMQGIPMINQQYGVYG